MILVAFIGGLIVGTVGGIFVAALAVAASDADDADGRPRG